MIKQTFYTVMGSTLATIGAFNAYEAYLQDSAMHEQIGKAKVLEAIQYYGAGEPAQYVRDNIDDLRDKRNYALGTLALVMLMAASLPIVGREFSDRPESLDPDPKHPEDVTPLHRSDAA